MSELSPVDPVLLEEDMESDRLKRVASLIKSIISCLIQTLGGTLLLLFKSASDSRPETSAASEYFF